MCTGVEAAAAWAAVSPYLAAASAGMQGLGMIQQANANNEANDAINSAQQAESMRQQRFDKDRMALIDATIPDYTADKRDAQVAGKTAEREAMLLPSTDSIGAIQPYNDSAPIEVKSDLANAMLSALGKGKNYAKTLSKLGSYGAVGQDNGIALNRTGQQLGVINNAAAGSQGIYAGAEIPAARGAGNASQQASDIFSGLGSIGTIYASSLKQPTTTKRINVGTQGGTMP